jgi:hypothetical protein
MTWMLLRKFKKIDVFTLLIRKLTNMCENTVNEKKT